MATYTAYDIARQIVQIRNYQECHVSGLCELPTDVLSAFLWLTAEWREVEEIESLIKMGANPHEEHEGFTVLEQFLQGHDGSWRNRSDIIMVEEGVKMLAKHGVTRADLKHDWVLSNCEEIINNSNYLREFFGFEPPERVKFYWHLPRAEKLEECPATFKDVDEGVKTLTCMTNHDQYIAVLEYQGQVTRYLVTKRAGLLAVIPMDSKPGWSKEQEMISNIVNFATARDEYPTLPCEE